jgi:putative glutamine amidotransferase
MSYKPRIAIPVPHSQRPEYAQRSLPQYLRAIEQSGGEPVIVQLDQSSHNIAKISSTCLAVLLPGSSADLDPQKYGAERIPKTHAADPLRDTADELLLQDAHNMRRPILAICYGLQSLNVWRSGTLVQDISSQLHSPINHEAGREVARAHAIQIDPISRLAGMLATAEETVAERNNPKNGDHGPERLRIDVNSSHHQAADVVGDGLRVAARCPQDGVIEALEGTQPGHFVVGVQWHPERNFDHDPASQALFKHFIEAARLV